MELRPFINSEKSLKNGFRSICFEKISILIQILYTGI